MTIFILKALFISSFVIVASGKVAKDREYAENNHRSRRNAGEKVVEMKEVTRSQGKSIVVFVFKEGTHIRENISKQGRVSLPKGNFLAIVG